MKKLTSVIILIFVVSNLFAYADTYDYQPEIDFARKAIKDGYFELAESKLNAILYLDIPKILEGEARLLLGRVHYSKADPVKALSEFNYVLTEFNDPDFLANAHYWSAEVYFDQGLYVRALSEYQTVINDYSVSEYVPFAIYSQAWCYEKMGEYKMAIDSYRDLIKKFPQKELAIKGQYKIAEILYSNHNNIEARNEMLVFIQKYPVTEKIFDAYYILGDIYFKLDDKENAINNFQKSLNGGANKQWKASAEYKLAKLNYLNGDLSESDNWFDKATQDSTDELMSFSAMLFRSKIRQKDMDDETGLFVNGENEMIEFYENILTHETINELTDEVFYLLGDYFYKVKKFKKSVQVYRQAIQKVPTSSIIDKLHYGYAWSLLRSMDQDKALKEFYIVVNHSNNDDLKVSSIFCIADIEKEKGNVDAASGLYDKILKNFPDSTFADQAQYELGVIFKSSMRIDASIMAFRALEENFPNSKFLNKTLFQLGALYTKKGDYRLANIQYDRIINNTSNSKLKDEALLQKAIVTYNNEQYDASIKNCRKISNENLAIKVRAEYYEAWAKYKLGKKQEALDLFSSILTKDQGKELIPGIKLWFGQYYYENGEFDQSIVYFNQIIEVYPATSYSNDAAYWLGWVLFDSGREQESLNQFRKLIKLYPESVRAPQAVLALGDIYLKKDETDLAINQLDYLIQKYPDNKITNIAKEKVGTIFKLQGKYMRAIDYYKMALTDENSEINSQIQFDTAECYDKAGLINDAIEEYLNVEYRYPKSEYWVMRALFRCAELSEKEGDTKRALSLYQKLSDMKGKEAELSRSKVKALKQYAR